MKLSTLFKALPHMRQSAPYSAERKEIRAVTSDPDQADRFSLFVAIRTPLSDGQYAVRRAYENGCRAFVVRRDPALPADAFLMITEEPENILPVILTRFETARGALPRCFGIAGTAGKTSVILMAEKLLRANGIRAGILTAHFARYEGHVIKFQNALPSITRIYEIAHRFYEKGCEILLLECHISQILNRTFDSFPFSLVVITSADLSEIEDGVLRGKREAIDALTSLARENIPFFIPQGSDAALFPSYARTMGAAGRILLKSVGTVCENGRIGTEFVSPAVTDDVRYFAPVLGDRAASDLLVAATVSAEAGLSASQILAVLPEAFAECTLEPIGIKNGGLIFRDSAYRPRSMALAIEALRPITKGRLFVLFGSVGERAYQRRRPLAEAAARADILYLTSDDPNAEDPCAICAELAAFLPEGQAYRILPDRLAAILAALEELEDGDVLLLAGKSIALTETVMRQTVPFDEKEIVLGAGAKKLAVEKEQVLTFSS